MHVPRGSSKRSHLEEGFACPLMMMVEGVVSAAGMTDSGTTELKVMDSDG
jgi:hypothetical protein